MLGRGGSIEDDGVVSEKRANERGLYVSVVVERWGVCDERWGRGAGAVMDGPVVAWGVATKADRPLGRWGGGLVAGA